MSKPLPGSAAATSADQGKHASAATCRYPLARPDQGGSG